MKRIHTHFTGSDWHGPITSSTCSINLRGTLYSGNHKQDPTDLLTKLNNADDDRLCESLKSLNGFWALTTQIAQTHFVAAVDHIRSLPLFYGQTETRLFISDNAEWVRNKVGDTKMDPVAKQEFQLTGYVTGQDTLFPNVKQLQAGEMLVATNSETLDVRTLRWFRFIHSEPTTCDEKQLLTDLNATAEASIRRLIDYANGRQIVVPLSGGYDSRLIALLLKRLDYRNIFTFTYGVSDNQESGYSKKIARVLNLPSHFVEYNPQKWRNAWQTKEREAYQIWGSGWSGLPHLQDWLAVREMKNERIIDADAIFCPGHTGDFIAGGHIPDIAKPQKPASLDELFITISQKHYSNTPCPPHKNTGQNFWKNQILHCAETHSISSGEDLANFFEKWEWQERQAKFIGNSVRVYEFYHYDWWMPLWDKEFVNFWQHVPLELRKDRTWYVSYVKEVQEKMKIDNSTKNAADTPNILKKILPKKIKFFLKRFVMGKTGAWKTQSSLDRYPKQERDRLIKKGYSHLGVAIHFFFKETTD